MSRLHITFVLALSLALLLEPLCFAIPLSQLLEGDSSSDASGTVSSTFDNEFSPDSDWKLSTAMRSLLGNYVCYAHECEKQHPSPPCKAAICKHGKCATKDKKGDCYIDGNSGKCIGGKCVAKCDPKHCPSDACNKAVCGKDGKCGKKPLSRKKCTLSGGGIGKCKEGVCEASCDPKTCPSDSCNQGWCDRQGKCVKRPLSGKNCKVGGLDGKCKEGQCVVKCDPKHCPSDECNKAVCGKDGKCGKKALPRKKCSLGHYYGKCNHEGKCVAKYH